MPYIKQERRQPIADAAEESLRQIENVGDLNYAITMMCNLFLDSTARNYEAYNSVIGVLECAKLEFYRRSVTPYEERKRSEHGDVY